MDALMANLAALGTILFLAIYAAFRKPGDYEMITPEPMPPTEPKPEQVKNTRRDKLYEYAKSCIGVHRGLDKSVPKELNCANALSHILILFGVEGLPAKGIASTLSLNDWLSKSPEFTKVQAPLPGDVVAFPTGSGNGTIRGHIFIVGYKDWMSNNSLTGLWSAHWTGPDATKYYRNAGGLDMNIYRVVDK